jgi:hypothetical protein
MDGHVGGVVGRIGQDLVAHGAWRAGRCTDNGMIGPLLIGGCGRRSCGTTTGN